MALSRVFPKHILRSCRDPRSTEGQAQIISAEDEATERVVGPRICPAGFITAACADFSDRAAPVLRRLPTARR
jgi:hypothetical protein